MTDFHNCKTLRCRSKRVKERHQTCASAKKKKEKGRGVGGEALQTKTGGDQHCLCQCISYATEGSTCLHKLGRSCTTNHLRKFMSGFEGASLAEAAVPPLSGVPGKSTLGLSLGKHTAFLPDSTQTKAQMGQARRPGLYKPVKETMSRRFSIFH